MTGLHGRRVVVIGGGSGIGFAIAAAAHDAAAAVVIASRQKATVDAALARLPGAAGRVVDLRDDASVAALFTGLGAFDHLAITAGDWGDGLFGPVATLDLARTRDAAEVRFWGVLAAVKHAAKSIARDGSITLTSGMLTHRPKPGTAFAAALGGAVEHLARGLAVELAPVRVNAVCPGVILTDHVRQAMSAERIDAYVRPLPVPRAGSPEEAAGAYLYLMGNRYVTGQVLPVDGGGMIV